VLSGLRFCVVCNNVGAIWCLLVSFWFFCGHIFHGVWWMGREMRSAARRPKLTDGGHEARRLEQEREAAVRCGTKLGGMTISITFQITRNIRCSNPTLAAISSPVRGSIVVETAR